MKPEERQDGAPRRRRWPVRIALAVAALAVALAAGGWALVGTPVEAPGWLRERVAERLSDLVPGATLDFDRIEVVVSREGLLRARLGGTALRAPDGTPIAALSQLEVATEALPLLRGEIVLREARASGAFMTFERSAEGRFGIGLGILGGGQTPPALPEVLARIDAVLADPRLSGLDRIAAEGLTVRYRDLLAGREWLADGGQLAIVRRDGALRLDGSVSVLGGGATAATLTVDAESRIGSTALSFGVALDGLDARDLASQSPALVWLDALRAPIAGSLRGWTDEVGALGGLDATLRIGRGVLQPTDGAQPVRFSGAETYFSYDPAAGALTFDRIAVESTVGRAEASGRVTLEGIAAGLPEALVGQFALSGIEANPGELFPEPLSLDAAELEFRLRLDPFRVEIGRVRVEDPEVELRGSGAVAATGEGWDVRLDATAERATPAVVAAHWPPALAPGTRDWFVSNVLGGRVEDAVFSLRREPGTRPQLYLDFRFHEAAVRFADTLPPAEGAAGQFTLYDDRLAVSVARGTLTPPEGGAIDIAGTEFVIPDTRQKPATGELRLAAKGRATAALSLLDMEPLSLLQKAGRPVDIAEADVSVAGTLVRPLGPGVTLEDMELALEGTLRDVSSDALVPGRMLEAAALDLSVTNERVRVGGRATLSGVPFEGSWTQPLGAGSSAGSRVEGEVMLSQAAADTFGIALPDGLLSGSGPGTLDLTLPPDGAPRFRLTSRLAGLGLSVPQIGWRLGQGTQGALTVAGRLGATPAVDVLQIDAGGLRASGDVRLRAGGGLDRVAFDRVRVGDWLDAPVTLVGRGGAAPEVQVDGGTLDLRGMSAGGGGGSGGAGGGTPISVRLDRLTISEGISLRGFSGRFVARAGGLDGTFSATMQGTSASVQGQLLPQNGGTAVRLASDDAGNVLESTGILRTVAGGRMVLNLDPVPGAQGTYEGRATITDARLRDAPAIGALLDAISIVGIIDQLEGPGIYFQTVDAEFRLTPRQVVLRRSAATGPSMGISMDGYVDLAAGTLDLQGVLSPIYVLNSIGSFLTRRGEGLLGFNFSIRGPGSQPQVAVNPLSVFTPGMFREIFRRPPPGAE
ncbi:AsmA-like C-terminal region-containing protein [Roseivivax isoporae]|uniref:YhdP central domain-containing protein n=1 Tax=Roseivivax isoporae LMG 25204 TaxID=1449351 RepID=X7F8Q5_9RHOB|nr:AsmA-like C-terminal region-containing protein [Roseivivax isoporae]ETX29093.1 hypothetical protein RISW2_02690 [Roseivivax isoporae LMG 25204]